MATTDDSAPYMQASEDVSAEEHDVTWVMTEVMALGGEKIMDHHINSAQRLISAQFSKLNESVLSLLQNQPLIGATYNAIQIFHVHGDHWLVAMTAPGSKVVYVYDSTFSSLNQLSFQTYYRLFSLQSL